MDIDFSRIMKLLREGGPVPTTLRMLERWRGLTFPGAFSAECGPVAPMRSEANATLLSAATDIPEIVFDWSENVEIIGIFPNVQQAGAQVGQLPPPTVDDILCAVAFNDSNFITTKKGVGQTGNFVSLRNLDTSSTRALFGLRIGGAQPRLTFQFQWRQGANTFSNADIRIGLATRASL